MSNQDRILERMEAKLTEFKDAVKKFLEDYSQYIENDNYDLPDTKTVEMEIEKLDKMGL